MPSTDRSGTSSRRKRAGNGRSAVTAGPPSNNNDHASHDERAETSAAIDYANAEAWRLRARDPQRAHETATAQMARAEAIGYDRGVAYALTTLAYDDMRRACYAEGQEKGERARAILRVEGDRIGEAWSLFVLGVLSRMVSDEESGRAHYDRAIAIAGESGRDDIAAYALNGIGNIHRHTGDLDAAAVAFEACRAAGIRSGDRDAELLGVYGLGATHLERGEVAEARSRFEESDAMARAIGFTRFLSHTSSALTTLLNYAGDYNGSLERRLEDFERLCSVEEWREATDMQLSIAQDYARLGEYALAFESINTALKLARDFGLHGLEGESLIRLGRLYETMDRGETVIDLYLRGLRLITDSGDYLLTGVALFYIGRWYRSRDDEPKALAYFFRCLRMYEKAVYPRGTRAALQAIGNAYLGLGDPETARGYYVEGLEVAAHAGDTHDEMLAIHALGAFETEAGRYDEAGELLERALATARSIDDREAELALLNELITLAGRVGDSATERRLTQQRHDLSRRIFSSEATRRVRHLIATLDSTHAWYEGRDLGLDEEDLARVDAAAQLWRGLTLSRAEKRESATSAEEKAPAWAPLTIPETEPHGITIGTLGTFTVERDGVAVPAAAWTRKRARDLFKLLLLNHRGVVTVAEIEERLWGETKGRIDLLVANAATHIRRALDLGQERNTGRPTLARVGEGYLLDLGDDVRIDFIRFQDLIIAARRAESAEEKGRRYTEALVLYRGGFLPEDTFAEWTDHQRRLLNDAWFEAAEYLAREALREGRVEQAIDHARRILQHDTTSESAWHVLLQGLIDRRRLGNLREEFERCRRAFDEAFGEEPPKRLERMVEEAVAGKG